MHMHSHFWMHASWVASPPPRLAWGAAQCSAVRSERRKGAFGYAMLTSAPESRVSSRRFRS
jgi:hypothetical protein